MKFKKIRVLLVLSTFIVSSGCSDLVATVSYEDRAEVRKAIETLVAPDVLVKYPQVDPSASPSPSASVSFDFSDRYYLHASETTDRPLDYYFHAYKLASLCVSRNFVNKYGNETDHSEEKMKIEQDIDSALQVLTGDFSALPKILYKDWSASQMILSPEQKRVDYQANHDRIHLLGIGLLLGLVEKTENALPREYYETLAAYRDLNNHLSAFAAWVRNHKPQTGDQMLTKELNTLTEALFDDLVGTIQGFHRDNLSTQLKVSKFTESYIASNGTDAFGSLLVNLKDVIADMKQLGLIMDREFEKRYVVTDPIKVKDLREETRKQYDQLKDLAVQDLSWVKQELENQMGVSSSSSNPDERRNAFCVNPFKAYDTVSEKIIAQNPEYYPSSEASEKFIKNMKGFIKLLQNFPLRDTSKIPVH